MPTHLAQNQFISNSAASPPAVECEAVAKLLPLSVATANNSSSDGGVQESPASIPDYNGVKSPALVTAHGLSGKSCPLSRIETGPSESEVVASVRTAAASDPFNYLTEADETLYWQLRHADNPFERDLPDAPDAHALFDAIIEIDVWADDAPLFLKSQV